jgi:hypothetical protein
MNPATMKALLVNETQPLADGMLPEVGLDVMASLQASLPLVVYDNGASTHTEGSAVGHLIAADCTETLPWLAPDFEILLSTSISVKRSRLRQVSGTGLRYTVLELSGIDGRARIPKRGRVDQRRAEFPEWPVCRCRSV